MRYLIDTNIVIYYFNGLTADEALHDLLKDSFNISIITKIEFLGWGEFAAKPELYRQAQAFMDHALLYPLNEEIAEQTIRLRQQFKTKTPDAIIAATAFQSLPKSNFWAGGNLPQARTLSPSAGVYGSCFALSAQ